MAYDNRLRVLSSLVDLDDDLIRALIVLEIISKSKKDFRNFIEKVFGRTWEYKLLRLFINNEPLNKSQLCLKLFPKSKDPHYKLLRPNEISRAFNYLLKNDVIITVKKYGRKKLYDVSLKYKPLFQLMFHSDVSAPRESC